MKPIIPKMCSDLGETRYGLRHSPFIAAKIYTALASRLAIFFPVLGALEQLFDGSRQFPIWVLSHGNVDVSLKTVVKRVRKLKKDGQVGAFRYTHLTGLSGAPSVTNMIVGSGGSARKPFPVNPGTD